MGLSKSIMSKGVNSCDNVYEVLENVIQTNIPLILTEMDREDTMKECCQTQNSIVKNMLIRSLICKHMLPSLKKVG